MKILLRGSKGRLLVLHMTLRVEQCSSYLGKTRLNWHGWLYSLFGAHVIVNIPTFGLPIDDRTGLSYLQKCLFYKAEYFLSRLFYMSLHAFWDTVFVNFI